MPSDTVVPAARLVVLEYIVVLHFFSHETKIEKGQTVLHHLLPAKALGQGVHGEPASERVSQLSPRNTFQDGGCQNKNYVID